MRNRIPFLTTTLIVSANIYRGLPLCQDLINSSSPTMRKALPMLRFPGWEYGVSQKACTLTKETLLMSEPGSEPTRFLN